MEIGASGRDGGSRGACEGSAVFTEKEQVFIDIIRVVKGLIVVFWLGSPDLRRKGDNVGTWVEVLDGVGAGGGEEGKSDRAGTVGREVEDRDGDSRVSQRIGVCVIRGGVGRKV